MPKDNCLRSLIAVAMLLLVLISGCTTNETPQPEPPTITPQPQKMQIDEMQVDEVFFSPPQPFNGIVYVTVKGTLPDSCTQIDSVSTSHNDYNEFAVTITTTRTQTEACPSDLVPFRKSIPINVGDLFADTYTVIVNGESYSFDMDEDFLVPETPDPGS
jgi:hypothetical protein